MIKKLKILSSDSVNDTRFRTSKDVSRFVNVIVGDITKDDKVINDNFKELSSSKITSVDVLARYFARLDALNSTSNVLKYEFPESNKDLAKKIDLLKVRTSEKIRKYINKIDVLATKKINKKIERLFSSINSKLLSSLSFKSHTKKLILSNLDKDKQVFTSYLLLKNLKLRNKVVKSYFIVLTTEISGKKVKNYVNTLTRFTAPSQLNLTLGYSSEEKAVTIIQDLMNTDF